jgi:hypothetical protein
MAEHTIVIEPDGTFTPRRLIIQSGDTVTWQLSSPTTDAIIPVDNMSGVAVIKPYDVDDPNNCTGPMPVAPGGVVCMSDDDAPYPIDPRIWESDLLTGVYYRFRWSDFEPNRPGEYDWTDFDAAMDACVAANKLCAIGWKAGFKGTPQWLFDDRNPDKIPGLKFPGTSKYALGSCAEPTYIERWNSFIAAAGERTRTRADWFRAVSYHKVAGINKCSA